MTETQTAINNKLAMGKALGAAFLNHQVQQLEKSVAGQGALPRSYRKDSRDYIPRSPSKAPPSPKKVFNTAERPRRNARDSTEHEPRTFHEKASRRRSGDGDKEADVIIVDASVLIHGIHHLKRWCRDGRQEIIIVPLEALNTLDLLKKGLTPLGSRARNASRILEAQVGANSRIHVQQDDAYVLWDKLEFRDVDDGTAKPKPSTTPEWVRRVICCARWELDHNPAAKTKDLAPGSKPKVVLAVCPAGSLSPRQSTARLSEPEEPLAAVPGPAPTNVHISKYEQRSNGTMVSQWAHRVGLTTMELAPTVDQSGPRSSEESDDRPRARPSPRNKSRTYSWNRGGAPGRGNVEELVERPPAVAAMMEMVSQPRKVIKVLARGEKLDPDT